MAEQPEEAIAPLKQFLARYPNHLGPHLNLAAAYSELGKETEARAEVAEVLRLNPQFSLEVHKEHAPLVSSKGFVSTVLRETAAVWGRASAPVSAQKRQGADQIPLRLGRFDNIVYPAHRRSFVDRTLAVEMNTRLSGAHFGPEYAAKTERQLAA